MVGVVGKGQVEVLQRVVKSCNVFCREWWKKSPGIHKNIAEQPWCPDETTDFKFVVIIIFIIVHRESSKLSGID